MKGVFVMQPSESVLQREAGLPYKWIVAGVVIFGLFMTVLDSTIVNIAIPRLQNAFGANLTSVQWVLTGYTLVQGVATPLTAFLSQRLGQKRLYLFALTGFTIGSALCGLSFNLPMLIVFRVIQGATGAFLSPLAITLLYSEFPVEERGLALGALGVPVLLAPAIGPTLGGYIVTFMGWQLIFYINVPIGIIGIVLGSIFLRQSHAESRTHFDIPGFVFSALGLALLLYGISDASTDGWGSPVVLGCLISGILLLAIFVILELNIAAHEGQPLLDVSVFANGPFTTSTVATILATFALYGGLFILPIYFQNLRGLSPFQAGLLLLPQAIASMIASVVSGRLVDKIGVRAVIIPGLVFLAIALWLFSSLGAYTPYGTIQIWLIIRSFALGFCFQPLYVSAFSEIRPARLPQATAVSTTIRFIVSSLAVAIMATLIQTETALHYAHLAEQVTPLSPLGQLVPEIQALFTLHGAPATEAYTTAIQLLAEYVKLQATVLAMQDAFRISLVLTGIAIIAAFFVRSRKPQPAIEGEQPLSQEEAAAQSEAALAV
jgi:EmrB/QacA subfamily drug resistance transporter